MAKEKLKSATIERQKDGSWRVVRERDESGESGKFSTLDEATEFIKTHGFVDDYGSLASAVECKNKSDLIFELFKQPLDALCNLRENANDKERELINAVLTVKTEDDFDMI